MEGKKELLVPAGAPRFGSEVTAPPKPVTPPLPTSSTNNHSNQIAR